MSTIGEGGMISCKSKLFYKKIWAYKDCGKNYDKIFKKAKIIYLNGFMIFRVLI